MGRTSFRPKQGPAFPQSLPRGAVRVRPSAYPEGAAMVTGARWLAGDELAPESPQLARVTDTLGPPEERMGRHGLKWQEEDHDGEAHARKQTPRASAGQAGQEGREEANPCRSR